MQIYQVGGSVRDTLLSLPVTEIDWVVVGATPKAMLSLGYKQVGKDFPVFLHPNTHDEYALARTERKSGSGHKGFVCYSAPDVTLAQDLSRRDLTINAMAMTENGELIDPYHGQADIQRKMLRHVTTAFTEDPLRVYRVARFQAKLKHLGFSIASETLALMQDMVKNGELTQLSSERVWQETLKALKTDSPEVYFETLNQVNALPIAFPHITEQAIVLLKKVIQQHSNIAPEMLLACVSHEGQLNIAIPKHFERLQNLAIHYHHAIAGLFQLAPQEILTLLRKTDALRRMEGFMQLVQTALLIHNTNIDLKSAIKPYKDVVSALKKLDISDLTEQYQHQALAKKIAERQIECITGLTKTG